jgi:hypothetical protein
MFALLALAAVHERRRNDTTDEYAEPASKTEARL